MILVFVGFLFHVAIVLILIAIFIISTSLLIRRRLFSLTFNGSSSAVSLHCDTINPTTANCRTVPFVEFYLLCCWNIARAFVFLESYQFACFFFVGVRIDQFHRVSSALHLIARPLKPPSLHSLYSPCGCTWTSAQHCPIVSLVLLLSFHRNNRQTIKNNRHCSFFTFH